ncbi:MAG TPA: carbonic anhydrase [Gemmatimonadaceae bacterium]|jgi:carbonic anhydrase
MTTQRLLDGNRAWAREHTQRDPDYFKRRAMQHKPSCLFIGCSDARVPVDILTQTDVGEIFVHRNIANQVVATDNNLQAVLTYAVEVLHVTSVVVCGHDDCGGVKAALGHGAPAQVDQWIMHVRNVARLHSDELEAIADAKQRTRRLVELNVAEQVYNLSRLPAVQMAADRGLSLEICGWVYGVTDGLLRELDEGTRLLKTA